MDAKFLALFALMSLVGIVSGTDLYRFNDYGIIELKQKNFEDAVYCKGNTDCVSCVVQFYNGSSKISKIYQTTYLQMASNVSKWSKIVKLGAVNCNDSQNDELCQQHNFDFVPIVKYFRRHDTHKIIDSPDSVYKGEEMKALFDPQRMVEQLGRVIMEDYSDNEYTDWPKFVNFPEITNSSEIWELENPCENKILFVIVDSLDQDITDFITLYMRFKESLPMYRITRGHSLTGLINLEHLPKIRMMLFTKTNATEGCENQPRKAEQIDLDKVLSTLGVPFRQRLIFTVLDEDEGNVIEYH